MRDIKFAGFWRRLLAGIIDLVFYCIYTAIIIHFGSITLNIRNGSRSDIIFEFFFVIVIPIILLLVLLKYKNGSLGKLITRMHIINIDNFKQPTFYQFIIRLFAKAISIFTFFLGYIHIGLDSRKQSWYDKIAGTAVVRNRSSTEATLNYKKITQSDRNLIIIELIWLLLIIISIFLNFSKIYYGDKLIPEAKVLLDRDIYEEKDPLNNGFYYLIGLTCDNDQDPIEIGHNIIISKRSEIVDDSKSLLELLNQTKHENDSIESSFDKFKKLFSTDDIYIDWDSLRFDFFISKKTLIDSLIKNYHYFFNRYNEIDSFRYYKVTYLPDSFSFFDMPFAHIVHLKRIKLAEIAIEYKLGDNVEALQKLHKEMQISRFIFTTFKSYTAKTIGNVLIALDLALLDKILNDTKVNYTNIILPDFLSGSDFDFSEAAFHTFRNQVNKGTIIEYYLSYNSKHFYLIPLWYNNFLHLVKYQYYSYVNYRYNEYIDFTRINLSSAYELNQLDTPDFYDTDLSYVFYLKSYAYDFYSLIIMLNMYHQTNGMITLMHAKHQILKNGIAKNNIQEFLDKQNNSLFSPFTLDPIQYDAENDLIFFKDRRDDIEIGNNAVKLTNR